MTTTIDKQSKSTFQRIPWWLGACLFALIALFFLWQEHRAHILGAIPYLLLLSCPLIHLFMHHGHDHGGSSSPNDAHSRHIGSSR